MKNKLQLFLTVVALTTLVALPTHAGKPNAVTGFAVTITVWDTDAASAPALMASDDFNGSGYAIYNAAQDSAISTDVYNDMLFLDLYSQTSRSVPLRTLFITPSPTGNPPAQQYWTNVEMYSRCFSPNGNIVPMQSIIPGTPQTNCSLGVDFNYAGVKYKLEMSPTQRTGAPATGVSQIACNVANNGVCSSWTLTNQPAGPNGNNANLYYWAKGGKLTFLNVSQNTFRIDFTNP